MKILLISLNISVSPYPLYPLGMSVIANALEKNGHDTIQFDFLHNKKSFSKIMEVIEKEVPDIIGFSIRNIDNTSLANSQNYIITIIELIRKIKKKTKQIIVLGGSGFSLFPEIILNKTGADYGFVGEAEETFTNFVKSYSKNILPCKKIIKNNKGEYSRIYPALYSQPIMKHYLKFGKTAPVQTKRGCTNKCIYCSYPFLEGNKLRLRGTAEVVNDIISLKENYDTEMIFFTDSLFNDSENNYISVLKEMKSRKIQIPWTAFFKPENFDNKTLELFKETGLDYVELGADAATDLTLKKMGKDYCFNDIKNCVKKLSEHNIISMIYYIFGGPGETKDSVLEGIENIKSIDKAVSLIFTGIRIIPGTPLHNTAIKENIIKRDDDLFTEKYYISPEIEQTWLDKTLKKEFQNIITCIYPPDSLDAKLRLLHSIGYRGIALNKLV